MSFSLTLYNVADDPRKIGKNLTGGTPVSSVIPTDNCDILTPTFVLNYNSSYTEKNYCQVGAPFNRFYFITDMKIDIGKKIEISCQVDPLETYKTDILNLTTTIYRNQDYSKSAPYIPDTEWTVKSGFQYYWAGFPNYNWDTNGKYVLSWLGNQRAQAAYVPVLIEPSDWSTSWGDYFYNDGGTFYPLTILYPISAPTFEDAKQEIRDEFDSAIYKQVV